MLICYTSISVPSMLLFTLEQWSIAIRVFNHLDLTLDSGFANRVRSSFEDSIGSETTRPSLISSAIGFIWTRRTSSSGVRITLASWVPGFRLRKAIKAGILCLGFLHSYLHNQSSQRAFQIADNHRYTTIMKFFSTLALAFIPSYALATTVGYDSGYGIGTNSLANVACSNGVNGFLTKGFTTYSSLPTFPNISSSDSIAGWNSPNCGSCWQLTYNGQTVTVTAIDHAASGFYTSQATLDALTNGHAVEFGTVQATATQVAASACGL